jgi:hypothetical protein
MENLGIYETYMYFAQIPGIGRKHKFYVDADFGAFIYVSVFWVNL